MPDFRAKMHQKSISSETPLGSLQRSPDSIAGFGGPTSKGKKGEGRGEERREGEGGKRGIGGRLIFQTFFRLCVDHPRRGVLNSLELPKTQ